MPADGDVVVLLGGRTGRDGIGGATGSSKSHNVQSIEKDGAEVQKVMRLVERGCSVYSAVTMLAA